MADVNHEHVSELLNIVEKCAGHIGKLQYISNEAMKQLLELNEQIRLDGVKAKEAAEAKAAAAALRARPRTTPPIKPTVEEDESGDDVKAKVYPGDSETETIADRRI